MTTAINDLERRAAAADLEADELREELDRLQAALDQACAAAEAHAESARELEVLLDESRGIEQQLRAELELAEAESASLRGGLSRARTVAEIRGRLLDDIAGARVWNRGKAIRRAERVQSLLPTG